MVFEFIWKQPKVEVKEVSKEVKDELNKSVHDQDWISIIIAFYNKLFIN